MCVIFILYSFAGHPPPQSGMGVNFFFQIASKPSVFFLLFFWQSVRLSRSTAYKMEQRLTCDNYKEERVPWRTSDANLPCAFFARTRIRYWLRKKNVTWDRTKPIEIHGDLFLCVCFLSFRTTDSFAPTTSIRREKDISRDAWLFLSNAPRNTLPVL